MIVFVVQYCRGAKRARLDQSADSPALAEPVPVAVPKVHNAPEPMQQCE